MQTPALVSRNLSCIRGKQTLFQGLDLQLDSGQWLYLQGENGAGKTSLLRILAGLTLPADGDVLWQGSPISKQRSQYHQDLLYIGHHAGLKEDLTLTENLQALCRMDGLRINDADIREALTRMGLAKRQHLPARVLSAGQKRRGLLARALLRPAKLWILDEPFNALDVNAIADVQNLLKAHLAKGGMLVLTSHQTPDLGTDAHGFVLNLSGSR
ncbi:MAG: cytochrome c biogenesis heme-transporting ATPase CcmA [Fluviibacter sp.]|jgi:heme exporter protein A|nr:cytochrome c biogenesis heme-transporting ATPase CcmA [Rhodocyclales bacterium]